MTESETPPQPSKFDLAGFGSSKGAAAVLNGLQIVVSGASAFSLVNWTSVVAPTVAIMGIIVGAVLHLAGAISSRALSVTVLISSAALAIGLYKVHEEKGPPPQAPYIVVRAFNDLDGDGVRGTYEKFLGGGDRVVVRFFPERMRANAQLLDNNASFNGFISGETVTVQVCGMDKQVKTYPIGDPAYDDAYNVEFAVPARQLPQCSI